MAVDSSPSIAPWNHERCAIFFVPPVGPFPTLGPLALVTAGFDAQTPATIQYDHLELWRASVHRSQPKPGQGGRALERGQLAERRKWRSARDSKGLLRACFPPLLAN